MPELIVFTTAYRAALPYLPAFLAGLAGQTDQGFRLLVALDDLDEGEVADLLRAAGGSLAARTEVRRGPTGADPVALRSAVLRAALPPGAGVVLLDSDDVPLPSRVAAARADLARVDVSACAMELVDEAGAPTGGVFTTPPDPAWEALLARCNVVGFGNAAYRADVLLAALPAPPGTRLLDWLVAVRALAAGATFWFDPTPRVRYRQHAGSMAGVTRPFGEAQLVRGAEFVAAHHALLLGEHAGRAPLPLALAARVGAAAEALGAFRASVVADPVARTRYVTALNAAPRIYRWWEWLAPDEQEST